MMRGASCAECALACPAGAITPSPDGVQIDTDACSGCGQCQAVCPGAALGTSQLPPVTEQTLVLSCDQAAEGPANIGCVHALGPDQIAALALSGLRSIAVRVGDCQSCADGGHDGPRLSDPVATINTLLRAQNQPELTLRRARREDRSEAVNAPARRRLFDTALPKEPPGTALRRLQTGKDLFAFSPQIDAAACTGCDACIRLCPEGSLTLVKTSSGALRYDSVTESCTGCRLCEDVCEDDAISVSAPGPAGAPVPLTEYRCAMCGVAFHTPSSTDASPPSGEPKCRICRDAPHSSQLFQVWS